MKKTNLIIKSAVALILLSSLNFIPVAHAEDLGLCPSPFSQGVVTTGFVDCNEPSNNEDTREEAEENRLEYEAICNATPRAEVTSSEIKGTSTSSERFYADVTCTITRQVPVGTTLCPAGSEEYLRAFDNVVCMYFGSAVSSVAEGQTELTTQTAQCTSAGGTVLQGSVGMDTILDDVPYYFAQSACILGSAVTDTIECPFGFHEDSRDEDIIECEFSDRTLETLSEAEALTQTMISICTDTTAGLGSVTSSFTGMTSAPSFSSSVTCEVNIPRYSAFSDQSVIRACDETCTEDIQQSRTCLNGGQIGGPGCTNASTQLIVRSCNTGPDRSGLCPLAISTMTVIPLLLLDDEDPD